MMITKTILLKENECALDAIASLGEDSKRAWIFIDTMCYHDLRRTAINSFTFDNNSQRLFWLATEDYPETSLVIEKDQYNRWFDVSEIYASDIAFTKKPPTPEIIFFITKDFDKTLKNAERKYVPEDMCPIDFVINMGDEVKDKTFIFPKYLVSKIMMGRMNKSIFREGTMLYISWDDNDDFMEFQEIDETHMYILINMNVDGFIYSNIGQELVYLI